MRRSFVMGASVAAASWVLGPGVARAAGAPSSGAGTTPSAGVPAAVPAQAGGAAAPARGGGLLVFGDSLSAEYGLARGSGWVAVIERRIRDAGLPVPVANASVSGETTAGGLTRLPAALDRHAPKWVVLELGANDALRGLPLASTEANLVSMVQAIRGAGARPVLVGMMLPPNFGADYAGKFRALFGRVARDQKVALVPFLLEGVADDPAAIGDLFLDDRIHPNARAQPRIADNVWRVLGPLLTDARR